MTFHAKLGTQGARARRLERLARHLAPMVGADTAWAARAALLAKADLTTGLVGEFPELQGVMGGYYAAHDGEEPAVAAAIAGHYAPKGAADAVPTEPTAIAVALGVIRIVRDNGLRLPLLPVFAVAAADLPAAVPADALLDFVADRLRVQLRAEGARYDVLAAIAADRDDDLLRVLARADALAAFLGTPDGSDLLAAARRAANILRIEDKKDGPHRGPVDAALLPLPEEQALEAALLRTDAEIGRRLERESFGEAISELARLRPVLDRFFDAVTVNAPDAALRENRLRLLARVGAAMARAADFSRIEG